MSRHRPINEQQRQLPGRAALSNSGSRFQPTVIAWDDGAELRDPRTECLPEQARSIISRNQSPDVPFSQSINPYRGCEHGCIYCYARPSHAYLDLSPGIDFETQLRVKTNAAEQLERELCHPRYRCAGITIGANTDPYQPEERQHDVTRSLLQLMLDFRHPVYLITKSALILRDLDLLQALASLDLVSVAISVTTLNNDLKRSLKPRAASGTARLSVIEQLSAAGVPVTLLMAPVIPGLNDNEIETIVERAAQAGARDAGHILLRMPLEIRELFHQWLATHYPQRASHVISLNRQCRQGADNDARFGHRMRGQGPVADLIHQRFKLACKRYGLSLGERGEARTDLFRLPPKGGDQLGLF